MSNLTEIAQWEAGIYQIEETDRVQGGESGISNTPSRQLANRTLFLNEKKAPLESPTFTGSPTAITPASTDSSKKIATTEFVNTAVANGKNGVTDGSSAAAGKIGQILENTGTALNLITGTETVLTSIVLTPGAWRLTGQVAYVCSTTALTATQGSLSNTTSGAAFPNRTINTSPSQGNNQTFPCPSRIVNVSVNTTYNLIGFANWSSGTTTGQGYIKAERVR